MFICFLIKKVDLKNLMRLQNNCVFIPIIIIILIYFQMKRNKTFKFGVLPSQLYPVSALCDVTILDSLKFKWRRVFSYLSFVPSQLCWRHSFYLFLGQAPVQLGLPSIGGVHPVCRKKCLEIIYVWKNMCVQS